MWVAIDGLAGTFVASSRYSGVSGSYYPPDGMQAFHTSDGTVNIAAVTADGSAFAYPAQSLTVVTSGWEPGWVHLNQWSGQPPEYTLYTPGGSALFVYCSGFTANGCFQFDGSPLYRWAGPSMTLNASGGWPGDNAIPWPSLPGGMYVNGKFFYPTEYYGSFDGPNYYCGVNFADGVDGEGMSAESGYWSYGGNEAHYNMFDCWVDHFSVCLDFFPPCDMTIPAGPGSLVFSFSPSLPRAAGPPRIWWNGMILYYRFSSSNGDYYADAENQWQLAVLESFVSVSGVNCGPFYGTYDKDSQVFSFPSLPPGSGCYALDETGNLLGSPSGIVLKSCGSSSEPNPIVTLGDGTALSPSFSFVADDGFTIYRSYFDVPQGSVFEITRSGLPPSPPYRYTGGSFMIDCVAADGWFPASNMFPAQLYVNACYAPLILGSQSFTRTGTVAVASSSYRVKDSDDALTLLFSTSGTNFTVTGTYGAYPSFVGAWDGCGLFGNLPAGLYITMEEPSQTPRNGPPQIQWNGLTLDFDRLASAPSITNPDGVDIYHDSLGLGLHVTIGAPGGNNVTLTKAGGATVPGSYNSATHQFTFDGQNAGNVRAVDSNGFVFRSGTNSNPAGTLSSTLEISGDFDIQGNALTLGTWMSGTASSNGLSIVFTDAKANQPSLISFAAARSAADWVWSHADTDGSPTQRSSMVLDAGNRLLLYPPPAASGTAVAPAIVLDPRASGTSVLPGAVLISGTILVSPQGELDMGGYQNGPRPTP